MENLIKKLRSSPFIINLKRTISCLKFIFLELLAVKLNYFYQLLMKWRKKVCLSDIKMAGVTSKDKVLHIGCGIIPMVSLVIAQEKKSHIIGIDNNKIAVKFARKIVEKHDLSDFIQIEYGDGKKYPCKSFNVIFIAINVFPIDAVLHYLSNQTKKNTRIIYKGYNYDINHLLKKDNLKDKLSIKKMKQHPHTQSFLLVKK
jgi:ribosomal protein L11 methylase PrmA